MISTQRTGRILLRFVALTLIFGGGCYDAVSACAPVSRLFAPKAERLDAPIRTEFEKGMASGTEDFDHDAFDALLGRHVDVDAGRVDYRALANDSEALRSYLDRLAKVDPARLRRDAQLALLINAYNACTLALILQHYPDIESIKDIDAAWSEPRCTIAGSTLTLDEIEHQLIRPLYRDPRIHFAVNCAAVGCPVLDDEAYRGGSIDEQLDRAARRTLGDPRYVTTNDDQLALVRILLWYKSDFVDPEFNAAAESVPAYVKRYTRPEVADFIDAHDGNPSIEWLRYDWALNDKKRD